MGNKLNHMDFLLAFLLVLSLAVSTKAYDRKIDINLGRIHKQETQRIKSLIYYSAINSSQNQIYIKRVQEFVNDLKVKLDLSQNQVKKIKSILLDYNKEYKETVIQNHGKDENVNNSKPTNRVKANSKLSKEIEELDKKKNEDVLAILEKNQVQKFKNIQNDWWAKVKYNTFNYNKNIDNTQANFSGSQINPIINNEYGVEGVLNKPNFNRDSTSNKNVNLNDTNKREINYRRNARELSIDLMKRLDLSLEQAADVRTALIEYQKDIYEARENNLSGNDHGKGINDAKNKGDLLGGRSKELIDAYRNADKKVNDKIENTLNKEQFQKYINIKNTWWSDVKDRIYFDEMNTSHKKLQNDKSGTDRIKYNFKTNKEDKNNK